MAVIGYDNIIHRVKVQILKRFELLFVHCFVDSVCLVDGIKLRRKISVHKAFPNPVQTVIIFLVTGNRRRLLFLRRHCGARQCNIVNRRRGIFLQKLNHARSLRRIPEGIVSEDNNRGYPVVVGSLDLCGKQSYAVIRLRLGIEGSVNMKLSAAFPKLQ